MSELTSLSKHCRERAALRDKDEPLWTQIADEVDAYLAGPDDEDVDQLALGEDDG